MAKSGIIKQYITKIKEDGKNVRLKCNQRKYR